MQGLRLDILKGERMAEKYVSEFLSLRCAGDVLNVVAPLGNKAAKEITESMAIIKALKKIVLNDKWRYVLLDMAAGNALTSVLAVHMLPVISAKAIDKRPRKRHWEQAKRFTYMQSEVEKYTEDCRSPVIIVAVHACKDLAVRIMEVFIEMEQAEYLILMPCCVGSLPKANRLFSFQQDKFNKYERWCLGLGGMLKGKCAEVEVGRDTNCLSPCNIIITARKERP